MRAVDVGLSLRQHDLMLIGTVRTLTPHGPSVHHIAPAIVIPKRCGVDITLSPDHTDGFLPLAGRILRLHHIHTEVGITLVGVDYRIGIGTVAIIRAPHL